MTAEHEYFTDQEAAFLRHARFGELPPRAEPEDWVELAETDVRQDVPEPATEMNRFGSRMGGAPS